MKKIDGYSYLSYMQRELELNVEEENEDGEILSGNLYCRKCDYRYTIEEGIPNLLSPETK